LQHTDRNAGDPFGVAGRALLLTLLLGRLLLLRFFLLLFLIGRLVQKLAESLKAVCMRKSWPWLLVTRTVSVSAS
jgi:hypothetical protein